MKKSRNSKISYSVGHRKHIAEHKRNWVGHAVGQDLNNSTTQVTYLRPIEKKFRKTTESIAIQYSPANTRFNIVINSMGCLRPGQEEEYIQNKIELNHKETKCYPRLCCVKISR